MINSMTGFGRSEVLDEKHKITVEIKSVNNRYLDLNIKMPRKFNALDVKIRNTLKDYMKRGKVDVFINYEDFSKTDTSVTYNAQIAEEYLRHIKEMAKQFSISDEVSAAALSRYPEVFTMEEVAQDEEELWALLEQGLRQAGSSFADARKKEGDFLEQDLLEKLNQMEEDVAFIEERAPQIVSAYKEKLRTKVAELLEDKQIDEARLLTEVTLFADKIAVDEELVRLKSHIRATKETIEQGDDREGVGRKLDFLAQEMNREANTILSKSNDAAIADNAISLKTGIEKVREQIQNVE